jgi:hypothetical protein
MTILVSVQRLILAALVVPGTGVAQSDPWAAMRVFEGKWEGSATGEPGKRSNVRTEHHPSIAVSGFRNRNTKRMMSPHSQSRRPSRLVSLYLRCQGFYDTAFRDSATSLTASA